MTTISSTPQLSNNIPATSTAAKENKPEIGGVSETTSSSKPKNNDANTSTVTISSKAKQLSSLKQDFFSGGAIKNSDIPKLAQRLVDIGLMDAKQLPNFQLSSSKAETSQTLELAKFAQIRADSIEDNPDRQDLFDMLSFVADVFTDIDSANKIPDFGDQLNNAIKTIDNFMQEAEFKTLPESSQASYKELKLGLSLVQQLPEAKIDQGKLDNYLRIAKGY